MEYLKEKKKIPVVLDADVLVAGAGIGGVLAALSAAREGARTILIERLGSVGGNYGPGLGIRHDLWQHLSFLEKGLGGIAGEMLDRLESIGGIATFPFTGGGDSKDWSWPGIHPFPVIENEAFSYLALKMLEEEGVQLLLSTRCSDTIMDGNRLLGLYIENKSGRQALKGKVVIDATGDCDVAAWAGAPCDSVYESHPSGVGLFFQVENVDWDVYESHRKKKKAEPLNPDDEKWLENVFIKELDYRWRNYPKDILPFIRKAWESGEYRYVQRVEDICKVYMIPFGVHGQSVTTIESSPHTRLDPTNGFHLSAVEAKFRMYAFETIRFFNRYVPGFEGARIRQISPFLGSRYSRGIIADHLLTEEEVWDGTPFDDVVHRLTHLKTKEGGLVDMKHGKEGTVYELPYRSFLPKGVEGLLGAGRNLNTVIPGRLRARWIVLLTGCIAGIAAAFAARDNAVPRSLDVKVLQAKLIRDGFDLGGSERLKELGL